MVWGHAIPCTCVICKTLPRINRLIASNSRTPGFVDWCGAKLRAVELEIRDELPRLEGEALAKSPSVIGVGGPPLPPPPPQGLTFTPVPSFHGWRPPLGLGGGVHPSDPHCTPKSKPPGEPAASSQSPAPQVKAEPRESSLNKSPVADPPTGAEAEEKAHKKKEKKKHRHISPEPRERREKSVSQARSSGRKKKEEPEKRKKRSRSRSEKKGVEETPRYKEKKSRSEPATPPEEGSGRKEDTESKEPRSPTYPPPRSHTGGGPRSKTGPGWIGWVPYSDHKRWAGKNKGVVKRAKQEHFNRRGGHRR